MTRNFYETKKVLKALQLPCDKIDVCSFGCMLFWEDDADLDKCKKCGEDRYKCKTTQNGKRVSKKVLTYFPLGPRLQRIYATKHIAGQMRWHYENPRVSGIMSHPSDGEAWKHFDQQHPQFSSEPRNVRLGLCTDRFQPFGQFGTKYSCWPVMVTPYNLPPRLCMKRQFIFLSLMIPGPKNPKQNLDIYLQPLVIELKELWSTGLFTYDVSRKQNFILRAALLWTINDFPAYVKDLNEVCKTQRKANSFVLKKEEKKALCDWVCKLKFPDRYASDLSRCVDKKELKLTGLKSHDCHVFMERLLLIALRHLLQKNEWNAITEISQFFRDLCASTIKTEKLASLENNIAVIICKLEKIFPPSFFNSMEHLPIHLPYEVRVGGPVQYRWMYPFLRFLNHLKNKIGNKARVEGSICNAYLLEEISNFCSLYFEEHIETKAKALDFVMNDDQSNSELPEAFQDHLGRTSGACSIRFLEDKEYKQAHLYVLSNCQSLRPYEERFNGNSDQTLSFPDWLRAQVNDLKSDLLVALAMGPSRKVRTWKRYSINGFNFPVFKDGKDVQKSSINNGVCVNSTEGLDYYGTLNEVIELCYTGKEGSYRSILFKCDWIDNSERGMNVHKEYKLVDVNRSKKYPTYDPFVLAHQVEQVCFAPYPNTKGDKDQWSAVFKTQARSHINAPVDEGIFQDVATSETILSFIEENEMGEEELEEVEELVIE
ncbi:uncharacterized protein LOC141631730 [Silene latifolia]|uniref:uncharacterized protein LOC141631730 n=1 Tax=Silene latifolia TaxID=37657 RepID=UPI003D77D946